MDKPTKCAGCNGTCWIGWQGQFYDDNSRCLTGRAGMEAMTPEEGKAIVRRIIEEAKAVA